MRSRRHYTKTYGSAFNKLIRLSQRGDNVVVNRVAKSSLVSEFICRVMVEHSSMRVSSGYAFLCIGLGVHKDKVLYLICEIADWEWDTLHRTWLRSARDTNSEDRRKFLLDMASTLDTHRAFEHAAQ